MSDRRTLDALEGGSSNTNGPDPRDREALTEALCDQPTIALMEAVGRTSQQKRAKDGRSGRAVLVRIFLICALSYLSLGNTGNPAPSQSTSGSSTTQASVGQSTSGNPTAQAPVGQIAQTTVEVLTTRAEGIQRHRPRTRRRRRERRLKQRFVEYALYLASGNHLMTSL
jgi:hypothetical protein